MPSFRMIALIASGVLASGASHGGERVVVELFTSQSCYSCPPAEAYLGELAEDPRVVALEWHVDYWDDLVYGAAGKWKDPFSDPAHTRRQADYNRRIRGTDRVYTPQMVIDGSAEAVGSRRHDVEALIETALDAPAAAALQIEPASDGQLAVSLSGTARGATALWLVVFIEARTTEVRAGENKGKALANHHVVTSFEKIGDWHGAPAEWHIERPAPGLGCAVLAQEGQSGAIAGASICPSFPGS